MEKKQKRTFRRRYLKDYELVVELNDAGQEVKVPRYIGKYYHMNLDEEDILRLRQKCVILSVLAAGMAIGALFLRHGAMASPLAVFPLAFAMFPLFYALIGSFHLPREKKGLRSDEVEYGVDRIRHSAPGITVLGIIGSLLTMIYHLFLNRSGSFELADVAFLLLYLSVTGCGALLWQTIRTVHLEERAQKNADFRKETDIAADSFQAAPKQ